MDSGLRPNGRPPNDQGEFFNNLLKLTSQYLLFSTVDKRPLQEFFVPVQPRKIEVGTFVVLTKDNVPILTGHMPFFSNE
jgi:hypothetical protein